MKTLVILSVVLALLSAGSYFVPSHAQDITPDNKPTFYRLTPGVYINGWPAFTVSYPKEWVELPLFIGSVFRAGAARPSLPPAPSLDIGVYSSFLPLEDWARIFMPVYEQIGTDIRVLSDKPSRLEDGTPTREVEMEWVPKNGPKLNTFILTTKKDWAWVWIQLTDDKGKIEEDLKKYAYSLTFQKGREEPVNAPADVREFLVMQCADIVSGDVETLLAHTSDRFLHYGMNKAFLGHWLRNDPTSVSRRSATSCEPTVTVFEPRGDKAYVDGFFLVKVKDAVNAVKAPMLFQQIIKEHGQWKWYGNQK
jgi:hypothetical protein